MPSSGRAAFHRLLASVRGELNCIDDDLALQLAVHRRYARGQLKGQLKRGRHV
jgi:hypothetical protein